MSRHLAVAVCLLIPSLSLAADDPIKDLKKQRLAVLVKINESARARRGERNTWVFDQVRQTKVDVFVARLDLAETKEERLKVCEEMLTFADEWNRRMSQAISDKLASPEDVLKAQAFVLEAKIALEKAKGEK